MKKYLLTVFFCVKIVFVVFSQKQPRFSYSTYLIKDDLEWSIAGNVEGENPNVFSELIFNNIISFGHSISFGYNLVPNVRVAMTYKKQYAFSGKGIDTDYASDNRTDVFSELKFISKKGEGKVMDFQVYYTLISEKKFVIDLGLGYLLQQQVFYLNSDEFRDLNSKYKINPQKYGVFIEIGASFLERTESFVNLKINKIDYYAEADWNLIQGLHHPISFTHKSNGLNFGLALKSKINVNQRFAFILGYEKSVDKYKKGIDILYLRPKSEKYTRFNGGKLNSDLFSLGFNLLF